MKGESNKSWLHLPSDNDIFSVPAESGCTAIIVEVKCRMRSSLSNWVESWGGQPSEKQLFPLSPVLRARRNQNIRRGREKEKGFLLVARKRQGSRRYSINTPGFAHTHTQDTLERPASSRGNTTASVVSLSRKKKEEEKEKNEIEWNLNKRATHEWDTARMRSPPT